MKSLYVLPVLMCLPMTAFGGNTNLFIGYDINMANATTLKIKDNTGTIITSDSSEFNDNNLGDFIFGIEFDDVMAVSINPQLNNTKTTTSGTGTVTTRMNEIDARFDIYLTRDFRYRPFVFLSAGYANMEGDVNTTGGVFTLGLGYRQYINNNFYFNSLLGYSTSTEMKVKAITGTPVNDTIMRISGFKFSIGAGYRF